MSNFVRYMEMDDKNQNKNDFWNYTENQIVTFIRLNIVHLQEIWDE